MYTALIRSVLKDWEEEVDIPCKDFKVLSIKGVSTINVYLSREEISLLEQYVPQNEKETVIRAQFLVACFTGARHSDVSNITESNIVNGYIVYVSKKTGIKAMMPAHEGILEMIAQANQREYCDSSFCATIKGICEKAGINTNAKIFKGGRYKEGKKSEFVSSHTARRAFATNLYLLGADIYTISKMMGHASPNQTARYICCDIRELSDSVIGYFK